MCHFYGRFNSHSFISADEVFILSHKVSSLHCLCYHVASLNFLDDDFYPSTPLNFSLIQGFPVDPSIFLSLLFTWYHYSGEWGFLPINRVSSLQCRCHLRMFSLFHFHRLRALFVRSPEGQNVLSCESLIFGIRTSCTPLGSMARKSTFHVAYDTWHLLLVATSSSIMPRCLLMKMFFEYFHGAL